MAIGVVKWFNNAKGYGFISADGSDADIFAHFSAIEMDGYKTLKQGQQVQFDVVDGPRGMHAVKIQPVDATSTNSSSQKAESPSLETA